MTDLYLITGFLGAGKTTFLKRFIRHFATQRIYLIINEFGKVGVDGTLLREMNAALAEINNGSIFCACRLDKFEEALADASAHQPDVILVEASGLADPTNIRKVLSQPQFGDISYRGGICLVDAVRFEKVVNTVRVCKKQLAVCSVVLLNKADIATPAQLAFAKEKISALNPAIALYETSFGAFDSAIFAHIQPQAAFPESDAADLTLQKALVEISSEMTPAQLRGFLTMLCEDTYRIKGFVNLGGTVYLADCVGGMVNLAPFAGAPQQDMGRLALLAGPGMPLRKSLQTAVKWYESYIKEVK